MGVTGLAVHHHGLSILTTGFSLARCSDVCAFECPPSPHDSEVIAANRELIELSGGTIPPLEGMRLVACGGNHTNTFLRCAKAGVKTEVAKLQDANGRLDVSGIAAKQPVFQKAMQEGMTWLIMDWRFFLLHVDV